MKKIQLLILAMFLSLAAFTQAPDAINYQMVVRDLDGEILADTELSIKFTILQATLDGEVVYREIHDVLSNQLGMVNLAIGQGVPESGEFSEIRWAENTFYLEVMVDFEGGGNYQFYGSQQLLAVPYALDAR